MGSTCGCISKEGEEEIVSGPNDLDLIKRFPSGDFSSGALSGRIAVPMVNLEKEFEKILESLAIENPIVNVLSLS